MTIKLAGFYSGICAILSVFFPAPVCFTEVGGEARGECVFNDQTVQFNFGVKDYGDLNRSYSKAYILFVEDALHNFTLI